MSVMTATELAPASSTIGGAVERNAADGHERTGDFGAPFGEAGKALRRPFHRFQRGGIDRTERNIVGTGGKRRGRAPRDYGC